MPSVLADPPPRSRWFSPMLHRHSKPALPDSVSEKRSTASKFSTLASVLGLRSKKQHPVLAIQSPPVFLEQPPPRKPPSDTHFSVKYANRPPSNSVSSTLRSSVELRTPSDTPRDPLPLRQSLFTLSDNDPFASNNIFVRSLKPAIKSPTVDAHTFGIQAKRFSPPSPVNSVSPFDPPDTPPHRQSVSVTSSNASTSRETHQGVPSMPLADSPRLAPRKAITARDRHSQSPVINTLSKSGSSSTLTDPRRVANSSVPSLDPGMQPREGTVVHRASRTFPTTELPTHQRSDTSASKSPTSPPTSARPQILRQPSASRIGKPPTAPPAHSLPPPPLEPAVDDLVSFVLPSDSSPSSSLLSFTSSLYNDRDNSLSSPFRPHREVRAESYAALRNLSHSPKDGDQSSSRLPKSRRYSLTKNLKKAASHQSFSSKRESVSSVGTHDETVDKHPRKYRSFQHHSRRPHSNRHSNRSDSSNFVSFGSHAGIRDMANAQKGATNTSSPPSRIRFFSGSSILRPSTSLSQNRDPDARSISSLPPENDRSQDVLFPTSSKPKSRTTSSLHESIRDEQPPLPPLPGSPEYIPQHILSPAEMLEVEASIEAATDEYLRGRRSRVPSSSTTQSVKYSSDMFSDFSLPGGFSSPGTEGGNDTPRRSSSIASKERSPLRLRTRPSTAHASLTAPTSPIGSLYTSSPVSTEPPLISLPPPPRPKTQRPLTSNDGVVAFVPLSPPPMRKNTRSNSSLESALMRRSILRKPSFLEIEDDIDKDGDRQLEESFLDLNRESFDTLRSSEQDGFFPRPLIL